MPRWLYIAVCLIALTAIMSVWGWVVNASVPSVHAWLIDHVGRNGVWAILAVVIGGSAVAAYRGRNPKGM